MIAIFPDRRDGKHICLAEINIVLFEALRQYHSSNLILNDFSD